MNNAEIGFAAGTIYDFLAEREGSALVEDIAAETKATKMCAIAALGWLAREDKIEIFVKKRKTYAKLKK